MSNVDLGINKATKGRRMRKSPKTDDAVTEEEQMKRQVCDQLSVQAKRCVRERQRERERERE
jgi:hypothetical protein